MPKGRPWSARAHRSRVARRLLRELEDATFDESDHFALVDEALRLWGIRAASAERRRCLNWVDVEIARAGGDYKLLLRRLRNYITSEYVNPDAIN